MTGELATKSECMEEWGGPILGARRRRYALQEHCGAGPWETRRPPEVCGSKGGSEVHWVWKEREHQRTGRKVGLLLIPLPETIGPLGGELLKGMDHV